MSCVSGSRNVAVKVGVVVLRRAASAGLTSVGVDGDAFVVLLVIEALLRVAVAAGLPVASALSRTIGLIGHWVDQKRQESRLIRLFDYLVNYAAPKRREVPPLK